MAWYDGVNVATGDLITAANWNNYLGLTGSLMYLKTQTDKLDDITHTEPTRVFGTIYQNTSGKIRFVTVNFGASAYGNVGVYCDANASPTNLIAYMAANPSAPALWGFVSFLVAPSWYYKVTVLTGTLNLTAWHEWDLL